MQARGVSTQKGDSTEPEPRRRAPSPQGALHGQDTGTCFGDGELRTLSWPIPPAAVAVSPSLITAPPPPPALDTLGRFRHEKRKQDQLAPGGEGMPYSFIR